MIPNLDTFEWEASKPIIDILRTKTYKDIVYLQELTGINYAVMLRYGYSYSFPDVSATGQIIPYPEEDTISVYRIKSTPIYYSHEGLSWLLTTREGNRVSIITRARFSKEYLSIPLILLNKEDAIRLSLLYEGLNWFGSDAPSRS